MRREEQRKVAALDRAMEGIKAAGFSTFFDFLLASLTTSDPNRSSQVTCTLAGEHCTMILNLIQNQQPDICVDWSISNTRKLIAAESKKLAQYFQPERSMPIAEILSKFSLEWILLDAAIIAPSTCDLLQHIGYPLDSSTPSHKNHELVIFTFLFLLEF